jgi:hypothetical protein
MFFLLHDKGPRQRGVISGDAGGRLELLQERSCLSFVSVAVIIWWP